MKRALAALLAALSLAGCKQPTNSLADAQACIHSGDMACAEANLKGYLLLKPEDMRATGLLAIILTQTGKHEEAISLHRKAIAGGLRDAQLYANYAGSLAATGDTAGAIAADRKALELDPNLVDVAMAAAGMLNDAGRPAEGVEILQAFDAHQVAGGHPAKFPPMIEVMKQNIPTAGATGAQAP
jgi:Flp pilus assembly protein TadD